jgi:hypothetical protein
MEAKSLRVQEKVENCSIASYRQPLRAGAGFFHRRRLMAPGIDYEKDQRAACVGAMVDCHCSGCFLQAPDITSWQ